MALHLPPRPRSVRTLSDEQRQRIGRIPKCPTCSNTGSFEWYVYSSVEWKRACDKALAEGRPCPRPEQVKTYECPCNDQYVSLNYLTYWGIHALYARMSECDITPDPVRKLYESTCESLDGYIDRGMGLYVQGGHGLGKSLLCALVAKEAIRRGHKVRFATFVDLLSWHESTWKGDDTTDAKRRFASDVQDVDLLVIDDLGKENLAGATVTPMVVQRFVSELLRQRTQRELSTFVSANIFAHQMDGRYGTDVASLLDESFEVVTLDGEDFRNKIPARRKAEIVAGLTRPVML